MRKLVFIAAALASTACVEPEEGTAFIEGALAFADDCTVQAAGTVFVATATLDIGFDAATANNLVLPLKVRTNLPSTFTSLQVGQDPVRSPNYQSYGNVDTNVITFNTSEVIFSTDADRGDVLALVNDGTPVNDESRRITGVSGVAFNEQTQLLTESVVFTTAITKEDAALLQGEQFIAEALNAANPNGSAANRVRLIANIRIVGTTTGSAKVTTPPFPFPVELCQGCLIPEECPEGQIAVPVANETVCVRGQDVPFVCGVP